MKEVVIVSGARTAVGTFGASLKGVRTVDLGALVIKEAIKRAGLRPSVNDSINSCRPDVFAGIEMADINKNYYDYDSSLNPVYFRAARARTRPARQASTPVFPKRPTPLPSTRSAPPA